MTLRFQSSVYGTVLDDGQQLFEPLGENVFRIKQILPDRYWHGHGESTASEQVTEQATDQVTEQVSEQATEQATDQVTDQATDQVTDQVGRLITAVAEHPATLVRLSSGNPVD